MDKFYEFYEREENTQRRERFFFFIAGATVVILIILGLNIWFNLREAQASNDPFAYTPTGASGGGCGMSGGGCGSTGLSSASLPEKYFLSIGSATNQPNLERNKYDA